MIQAMEYDGSAWHGTYCPSTWEKEDRDRADQQNLYVLRPTGWNGGMKAGQKVEGRHKGEVGLA